MSDVSIIYCRPCGYEKRAKEVAAALRERLALAATLVAGKGGIFEVKVGDRTVAKRSKGHFPEPAEVVEAVAAYASDAAARTPSKNPQKRLPARS